MADDRDVQRLQEQIKEVAGDVRGMQRDLPDRYIPRRDLDDRFRDMRDEYRKIPKDMESLIDRMIDEATAPILKDLTAAHEMIRDLRESGQFIRRAALTALISGLVMMGYTLLTQFILKH